VCNTNDDRLRRALDSIPVPAPGDGFNARILAALAEPQSGWPARLTSVRPMVHAAVCALAVTLILLRWSAPSPNSPTPVSETAGAQAALPALSLDNVDLTRLSLLDVEALARRPVPRPAEAPQPQEPDLHSDLSPDRKAALA
jgi:hypothetical protein